MTRNEQRVVVGMSGGVDSSVAAGLLIEQGYDVIGITIKTYKYEDVGGNVGNDSSCCSLDGINDARRVAMQLGFPHYTVDWTEVLKQKIIDYFVEDYLAGNTPNPCTRCNRLIKWEQMLAKADALGAEYIATGHYAEIVHDPVTNRRWIRQSPDAVKDQSYMLWGVKQEHLARTIFPLSGFTKQRSRSEGERLGLHLAQKQESYEICFVADNDYRRFLKDVVGKDRFSTGNIVQDDHVIGHHEGYPFYTIGQRKGIGVSAPEPLFVLDVVPSTNTVKVGKEHQLYHDALSAKDVNLLKYETLTEPIECTVKVRYRDNGALARCWVDADGLLQVRFAEPRKAIARGQSVVMYEGTDVIGGGVITSAFNHNA
ncbi:MAG: tRNA 2-thiouridine(34) synthase MnmA [Bradyrhizobiaceae bacterium]|nr:tRNA 2-thiouridine(34) synthase MnmA [Bradyrhizobiaceae bacterium]